MLISTPHQKVILNLQHPERVCTVIPTAKRFLHEGHELVAVPHGMSETRALNDLGIVTPAPIKHYYKWPGQYAPFHAQRETAAFLTMNPKSFVLNDMGTGKTLATLWAFDYLRSLGLAKKMLVISPLSTLERTWADEVFQHFSHLNVAVLYGNKARRTKMLNEDVDIYLVNHDGIKVIVDELVDKADIDTIVVDEVASFRNAGTDRWRSLRKIVNGRERVWGLTGTPTPNLPTDAWAQCRLIVPDNVPKYFGAFKDSVLKQMGPFKWIPRDDASTIVGNAMQPAIRFTRDDCIDLPECIYQTRHVEMTGEQKRVYKEMATELASTYQSDNMSAVNAAVKMQKLVQIACGVVYGQDDVEVILPNEPRVNVLREIIEEAGTKVIVFVPFKGILRQIAEKLTSDGIEVAVISGDVGKTQRDEIFSAFQNPNNPLKVLVAQPAAMSHGLTLTAASTVVWYAPVTSNEIYQQANARITRPGQKHTQFIVNVAASEVERRIYARLKDKQSLQGLLLDSLHDSV